jgi:MFS superfamily sulfate permease-like transporter
VNAAQMSPEYRQNWRRDLRAAIVVFLIALPLCLGIALASGAPLIAGLVTGVIGGLVVGFASDSHLMVSGPAAGLTAVVLSAITTLGGFGPLLTAIFLAGLLQMALGALRAGVISRYVPHAVMHGMLAGIGLIIIRGQLPYAFGADIAGAADGIAHAFSELHGSALAISVLALGLLVLWEQPYMKLFAAVPGALVAVLVCSALNLALGPGLALTGGQLVNLPLIASPAALLEALDAPDWTAVTSGAVWMTAVTIAIIASLETLLSLEATDRMDPMQRTSSANRELLAQGLGNAMCGLAGGLPMTGVIARSSANVYAGARTRISAIVHGVFLLVAVLAAPMLLNLIPLAVLAVVLIYTGWKLAHPRQLPYFLKQGVRQWLPFIVTIVAILATDLLIGIAIGLGASLLIGRLKPA